VSDRPLAARNGESDPRGKLSVQKSLMLSPDLDEALTALSVIHRMPFAEYIRLVLSDHAFGKLARVQERYGDSRHTSMMGNEDTGHD